MARGGIVCCYYVRPRPRAPSALLVGCSSDRLSPEGGETFSVTSDISCQWQPPPRGSHLAGLVCHSSRCTCPPAHARFAGLSPPLPIARWSCAPRPRFRCTARPFGSLEAERAQAELASRRYVRFDLGCVGLLMAHSGSLSLCAAQYMRGPLICRLSVRTAAHSARPRGLLPEVS